LDAVPQAPEATFHVYVCGPLVACDPVSAELEAPSLIAITFHVYVVFIVKPVTVSVLVPTAVVFTKLYVVPPSVELYMAYLTTPVAGEEAVQFTVIELGPTLVKFKPEGAARVVVNAFPVFPGGMNAYTLLEPLDAEFRLVIAPDPAVYVLVLKVAV